MSVSPTFAMCRALPPSSLSAPHVTQGIVELCILRYRDSDSLYVGMAEAALCALRSQVGRSTSRGATAWQCH